MLDPGWAYSESLTAAACVSAAAHVSAAAAAACIASLQLFHSLKSHAPGDSEWDDLVAFLQEFCSLAKHLQLQHRQNLWNKMTQLGMFEVRRGSAGLLLLPPLLP
jgi:hypothetical protein